MHVKIALHFDPAPEMDAARIYEQLYHINPTDETVFDGLTRTLVNLKRYDEAEKIVTYRMAHDGSLDVLRYGRLLKPRQLVGVRGAGLAFDGLYFVKSVTSTMKRGEFKQSFELTRNGLVSITPTVPV